MRAHICARGLTARMVKHTVAAVALTLVATLVAGMVLVTTVATSAPAQAWENRTVTVSDASLQIGDDVQVSGNGFPAGEFVDVEVCGTPDESGELACTLLLADIKVATNGTVRETVTIEDPTGPCPCSVVVRSVDAPPTVARIELLRHDYATQARAPELVVDRAELVGGNLLSFFGAPASKNVELTLRNVGVAPADPTLQLSRTKGGGEPVAITDPGVGRVDPGQTRTVVVPVDFDGLSRGEHAVSGHVVVGDLYAAVDTSTSMKPWGLYALLLLLLGGAAVQGFRMLQASPRGADPDGATPRRTTESSTRSEPTKRRRPAADKELESLAELTIARATGTVVPDALPQRRRPPQSAPPQSAPQQSDEYVGPPRLAATPLAKREDLDVFGDTRLPVAPPAPLATPTPHVPPAATLDAASYMQAYMETHVPGHVPDPAPTPPTPRAEPTPPAESSWETSAQLAEVPPAPFEAPAAPATPARGLSVAERIAQATESTGVSGEEYATGPRTAGTPVVRPSVHDTGADIVARALETIKEHSGEIRLADKDEYVVPVQRDRRAPKGGRRAAR